MQFTQDAITTSFAAVGARVKVVETDARFSIDIRDDGHGEFFHLMVQADVCPTVADVRHADRHLLKRCKTSRSNEAPASRTAASSSN
jgi:hypothetical protein